jgi:3-deoxy-manno-octulosonate cytidylyltransferase (CMP-KDO synthetase)
VWNDELLKVSPPLFWQHIGLYAYRRKFLAEYPALTASPLEQTESLEQLRVLQAGLTISVGQIDHAIAGIDTDEDYRLFVSRQK